VNQRRPFDTSLQGLSSLYSRSFLTLIKGKNVIWVQELNTVMVAQQRRADFLIRYRDEFGKMRILHIEFQNQLLDKKCLKDMPYRMAAYSLAVRGRYGQVPEQVLILLKNTKAARDLPSYFHEGNVRIDYQIIRLWEMDPKPVLESGLAGLMPIVPLMSGKSVEQLLEDCTDTIAVQVKSVQERSELVSIALLMASLRRSKSKILEFMRRKEMTNILTETPLFKEVFGDLLEEKLKEKVAEAKLKLQTEADQKIEEAVLGNQRQVVIEALEHKFGVLPQELKGAIESVSDVPRLKQMLYAAMDASTLEIFQQQLNS
jgi:predicted transposase YdaD